MTYADLHQHVEAVLGEVDFEPPVSVAYCQAVYNALKAQVPDAKVDAYHRHTEVVVEARLGAVRVSVVVPCT